MAEKEYRFNNNQREKVITWSKASLAEANGKV
jgi:hypothetical protein